MPELLFGYTHSNRDTKNAASHGLWLFFCMDALYVALIYPFLPTERPVASTLLKESFRIVIFIVPIVLLADSNFKISGTPVDTANIS